MKAHWQILHAIALRIGLFAGLLLSIPLAVRLYGLHEANPVASMIALAIGLPAILYFVGGLLGGAVANLLGGTRASLIPAYRRRVLTVSVLLGLCMWALVPLYYLSGGFAVYGIPWLRWVPLWSYGLLGLGFVGGLVAPDLGTGAGILTWSRASVVRSCLVALVWLAPTLIGFTPSLRNSLNAPLDVALPGVTPMAMLCLLLGPLSWPAMVRLAARLTADVPVVKRNLAEQMRSGSSAAWGLSALVGRTHKRARLRIEFLVFQPALLSMVNVSLIFAAVFVGLQVLWAGLVPKGMEFSPVLKTSWQSALTGMFAVVFMPVFTGAIDLPRLGRSLLLPGQIKRQNLPGQLFKRLLSVWIGGALAVLIPVAAISLWMGAPASTLAWFSILVAWGIYVAAAFEFFRAPRSGKKAAIDPVGIALGMCLLMLTTLAKTFFFDIYPIWVCLTVIACAFVIPAALYGLGLKRWATMEYGA